MLHEDYDRRFQNFVPSVFEIIVGLHGVRGVSGPLLLRQKLLFAWSDSIVGGMALSGPPDIF